MGSQKVNFRLLFVNYNRVKSALFSKSNAGRWALCRKLLSPFCRLIDLTLYLGLNHSRSEVQQLPQVVLLCSPPRSGSTVIYQTVCRSLDCDYITNLHQLFPRTGSRLKSFLNSRKAVTAPKTLSSYYGHTKELSDVNEGNEFIDYWFKTNDKQGIRSRFIETIRWLNDSNEKPVIIKNVGVYDRIDDLFAAVPELIVIKIQRERQQVVESELKGFYELGYFNPIPKKMVGMIITNPAEYAVMQILEMEKVIDKQLASIPQSKTYIWNYDKFCLNPSLFIAPLAKQLRSTFQNGDISKGLRVSKSIKVSKEDSLYIEKLLSKELDANDDY